MRVRVWAVSVVQAAVLWIVAATAMAEGQTADPGVGPDHRHEVRELTQVLETVQGKYGRPQADLGLIVTRGGHIDPLAQRPECPSLLARSQ